jgi:hypothetical protein
MVRIKSKTSGLYFVALISEGTIPMWASKEEAMTFPNREEAWDYIQDMYLNLARSLFLVEEV